MPVHHHFCPQLPTFLVSRSVVRSIDRSMNYLLNHAYPIDKSEFGLSWSNATNRAKSEPRTPIMMTTRGGSMEDKNQKNFPVFRPAYQKHLGQARRRFDDGQLLISEFCRHCDFHPPFLVWWSGQRRRRRIPSSHQPWMRKKKLQLHEVHRISWSTKLHSLC